MVQDETRLLREAGHLVESWTPSVAGVRGAALLRTGLQTVWSREAARTVRRFVEQLHPDVIHCHNLYPALSPAVLRATGGVPVVVTLHNFRLLCLPATLLRDGRVCEDCVGRTPWPGVIHGCYRGSAGASAAMATSLSLHRRMQTFNKVARYLAVSSFVRAKHIEAGFPADRITVKPNFAHAAPRRQGAGEYFLYLGRLAPEKDVQTLLKAWADVPAPLLVVGDGPEASQLRAASPPNVEFLGLVKPSVVATFLHRARALLLPSIWYEGQPRTVLEAYAAGVPTIVSAIGGLPEVVEHDVTGMVVPPRDVLAWRRAAEVLLDDTESERLGEGAWRAWMDRYTPTHALESLESAYRRVVG